MKIDKNRLNTSMAISHGKLKRMKADGPWVCSWAYSWIYFSIVIAVVSRTYGDENPLVSCTLENFIMLGLLENGLFSSMIFPEV